MRTHVILPDDLVEGVDKLVGKRKRSRFVEEAVLEKLKRERLGRTGARHPTSSSSCCMTLEPMARR